MFLLRVIVSFLIAGAWIGSTTLLAERLGSKIGGLFTNLPSTVLISLIFVALGNDLNYVVNMVPSIPIGMTINTLFLLFFIVFLKYGLVLSTIISLLAWFVLALLATLLNSGSLVLNVIIYVLVTLGTFILLEKGLKIPSAEKSTKKYSFYQMLIRAGFAGGVVASVVIISKYLGPYVVGIFSTFPAVLLSAMVILVINQNKDFARATGKILVLSSTNIVVYGVAVHFTYLKFGLVWGTVISFVIAFLWVCLFRPVVQRLK